MNNIQTLGKFLDQPVLVSKFQKAVPVLLTAGAGAFVAKDVFQAKPEERKEKAVKAGVTMGATVAAALSAAAIASAVTKRPLPPGLDKVKAKNKELIDTFVKNTDIEDKTKNLLEKGKDKILGFKEVKTLFNDLKDKEGGKDFLKKLIPDPENISAKDIFSEIGYLSVYGAVPVLGGIAGGIAADKMTDKKNWKEKVPDKIKEGSYQYLANIFMCNVGAGAALGLLEKAGIQSKAARAAGMTAGIVATGIIGGSKIANVIGKKVIDPVCDKLLCNKKKSEETARRVFADDADNVFTVDFGKNKNKVYTIKTQCEEPQKEYKERTPEVLDIGLHTDDIATVSLLSGLKWIEPALPVLYTVSGYRAGTGYRN